MPITVNKAKKILGKSSKNLPGTELQDLINSFYSLGEIIAENISSPGSKSTTKGLELVSERGENDTR